MSLRNLLGNDSKDRHLTEEVRAVLHEMQKESARFEALLRSAGASGDRLSQLGEPLAKANSDVATVTGRLEELELRLATVAQASTHFQFLEERAEGLAQRQHAAEAQIATAVEEVQRIRSVFDEIGHKVDLALDLKDRLGGFLEVEKPFQQLRGDAQSLREQIDGTSDLMARLREQHDRLMDAHKLAMQKMEALDHRRDVLGRELTDKERRVASVEQAVRGMDGIQHTVDDVKRDMGTLKALGDTVVQKTAALEAQREAVERALAEAQRLDQAMRQLDQRVRQQQENESALGALQEQVGALRSLHEAVVERSSEIAQLQREAEEQTKAARQDMAAMTDEMKKTVDRFDFESRGLESVNQRVADLRGALSDFENRFKGLNESRQATAELKSQTQSVATQLQALTHEVGQVDREMGQLRAIRRDLDETTRAVKTLVTQVTQMEEARPSIEAALRDVEQLGGAHALVADSLERTRLAHDEMTRVQDVQGQTRAWLEVVGRDVVELRDQVGELNGLAPSIAQAQAQAQLISESLSEFESRRASIEDLQRRMAELVDLGERLDERGLKLQKRMESAEQQFAALEAHAEEAERLSHTVAGVSSNLKEAGRKTDEIKKTVAAVVARCQSVEALEGRTQTLQKEVDQRQNALAAAAKELQKASDLRQKAAASAQKLGELTEQLTGALSTADERVNRVGDLATQLEDRAVGLGSVEKRLGLFEERLAQWNLVEQEVARSLEQIVARQGTVEALQSDLERMFAMAEKTADDVRAITSSHREIEQSRKLLDQVTARMDELKDSANALDERKRQMTKAEERLARAEALLVDVRSSLEALQGQKALVDQAVEKTGSLQFLLKQAETTIEGLREEREITSRVRDALAVNGDEDEGGEGQTRVA